MPPSALTIGKVAKHSNVSVETIRYYQKIGLLKEPQKPLQGFRTYTIDTVSELKFIKKAQRLGFSLTEISELLEIGSGHCADIQSKARNKLEQISQQISELQLLEKTLNELVHSCELSSEPECCPIVKSLSES
ncbi:MAG: MerR family DNA-binding protein [Gammaproteobacteria bacterium]|nr:MerR family DNA-binding protein [Gammaproteobacteria bacterium]